ncbi:universal stress protein [Streptomyces sp. NE06-03E]|uniref:universal stress protein n=1 Tax=unclassified Streptomyces TaxID=2593676 RepID=UPI0029BD8BFD|nr:MULTISPECIES: universal stress protein [unclassified Streptomyces]MDX3054296.1 universal stress protein [Streptomyces sp. NE06-03E]
MGNSAQPRIVVGVSGSLSSLVALQRAGQECRLSGRRLLAVLVWRPDGSDTPPRVGRSALRGTRQGAMCLLRNMLNDVFAATDDDMPIAGIAIAGSAGQTLVQVANRDSDVLVIGGGHGGQLRRWRSPVTHHCLTHAACPVLTVPVSPLQRELETLIRRRRLPRMATNVPAPEAHRA